MSRLKTFLIFFKFFLLLSISIALANDPNKIVAAKVDEYIITAQDVLEAHEKLPPKIKEKPLPDLYPNIVNELINQHLITEQAYKEKLDLNKVVINQIKKNKDQIVARYWINNFLINIGGDILTKGYNDKKQNWVIGIENPNLTQQVVKEIVNVTNKGIATSGDYKNFYDDNGIRYSHIINPKTGMPIKHSTKSVTVIEENAMLADGWATALLVMGSIEGLKIAEKENISVLFIDKTKKTLVKIKSSKFKNIK